MHYEYPFDGIYDFGRPASMKAEFSHAVVMDLCMYGSAFCMSGKVVQHTGFLLV
jgi:hypothetical protein